MIGHPPVAGAVYGTPALTRYFSADYILINFFIFYILSDLTFYFEDFRFFFFVLLRRIYFD